MFLKDDKKLSPRNYPGLTDFRSPLPLRAMDINFADIDFSLLAEAQFFLSPPSQEKIPKWSLNHALESLQTIRFRSSAASLEDPFLKTIFLKQQMFRASCLHRGRHLFRGQQGHHSHQGRLSFQESNHGQDASSRYHSFHGYKTPALPSLRLVFLHRKVLTSST